jgi:hypothetical protein
MGINGLHRQPPGGNTIVHEREEVVDEALLHGEARQPVRLMLRSEEASVEHLEVERNTSEDNTKNRGA